MGRCEPSGRAKRVACRIEPPCLLGQISTSASPKRRTVCGCITLFVAGHDGQGIRSSLTPLVHSVPTLCDMAYSCSPGFALGFKTVSVSTGSERAHQIVSQRRSLAARSRRQAPRTLMLPKMTVSTQSGTPRLGNPAEFLDRINTFIFDCDGVIWRGNSLIEGSAETVDRLRALGKRVFFVTNNSTKSRAGFLKKVTGLGLNVEAEQIFSSSFAAAAYLEQTKFASSGKKVYVIGEIGICEELDLIGVPYIGGPEDSDKVPNMSSGGHVDHDRDVGAVVVGFDRHINYYKMQYAQLCINENPGCKFIATNLDEVTHLTDAQEWAGNGAMVGAIKGCTGQEPIVVGKPSPLMIDYITERYSTSRHEICMVGDRLDTDVLFGTRNGLATVLALSGVTKLSALESPENSIRPDYYIDRISDLFH
jgi:phosphoglycolate phosphatase